MTIGINGFEAVVPRFGFDENGLPNRVGSSNLCFEVLKQLHRVDKENEYIIYLPTEPTKDLPVERDGWTYTIIPNTKLWTIFGLTREMVKKPKIDVLFSPTHYGPLYAPCPQVISILDLSYKYFPELFTSRDRFQLGLWGSYSAKNAAKIITISEASKNDIMKFYGIPDERIVVTPLGIREDLGYRTEDVSMETLKEKYKINKPYILFVGTLQPRKNIERLIEAFSKLRTVNSELSNHQLVIVGKRGWLYEPILAAPEKYGVTDSVKFLDSVTDEDISAFYKNAECFVLPSLYEGFGLPVLEAMQYDCPVITSNISSLPEAGGDAAVYCDPESVDDIAQQIKKVLSDSALREDMVKKGREQVKKFSWEKTAKQTLSVLEQVARK